MEAKTISTVLIVVLCILLAPFALVVLGGVFGVVVGVLAAAFGGVLGLFGSIFGGLFGFFGEIFGWMFDWDCDFGFFDVNPFAIALILLVVVLLTRNRARR